MTIEVLAIINGDPSVNAGARLRMMNWITALKPTTPLRAVTLQQRQQFWPLFQQLRRWLRQTHNQRGDEAVQARRVIIVQKAYSLKIIALLIWLRLADVAIVQDICDPPIKYFNPHPFSRSFLAMFYLSFVAFFFADHITVPTSVLARSLSNAHCGISQIPDCIDTSQEQVDREIPQPDMALNTARMINHRQRLRLLWFGSPAREGGHSGINEVYAALSDFQRLSNYYCIQLDVCTELSEEHIEPLKRWCKEASFMTVHYYRWSVPMQLRLLQVCDFHFFPRLQSLATFYKSPNRVVLAASQNIRTVANMIPSDDYSGMNIVLVEDLIQGPMASLRQFPEGSDPFPERWRVQEICGQWHSTLESVCELSRQSRYFGLDRIVLLLAFILLLPFVLPPHRVHKTVLRASANWAGKPVPSR